MITWDVGGGWLNGRRVPGGTWLRVEEGDVIEAGQDEALGAGARRLCFALIDSRHSLLQPPTCSRNSGSAGANWNPGSESESESELAAAGWETRARSSPVSGSESEPEAGASQARA